MTRRNWTHRAQVRQLTRRVTQSPVHRSPADWTTPRPVAGWRTQYPAEFPVTMKEIHMTDEPDLSWWTADRSGWATADLSELHFADLTGECAA